MRGGGGQAAWANTPPPVTGPKQDALARRMQGVPPLPKQQQQQQKNNNNQSARSSAASQRRASPVPVGEPAASTLHTASQPSHQKASEKGRPSTAESNGGAAGQQAAALVWPSLQAGHDLSQGAKGGAQVACVLRS